MNTSTHLRLAITAAACLTVTTVFAQNPPPAPPAAAAAVPQQGRGTATVGQIPIPQPCTPEQIAAAQAPADPQAAGRGRGGRLRRRDLLGRARLRNRNLSYGRAASLLRRCGAGTLWRWRRILCEDRGHGQKKSSTDSDAVNVSARVHFHSTGLPKSPYMRTISAR